MRVLTTRGLVRPRRTRSLYAPPEDRKPEYAWIFQPWILSLARLDLTEIFCDAEIFTAFWSREMVRSP